VPVLESPSGAQFFGKFKGFVRRNDDPENRGRVRVYCPQVMGPEDAEDQWLGWAEPCFPWVGGMNTGDFGPPFTREQQRSSFGMEWFGVWIEFEQGIPDFPIWVGTFTIAPKKDSSTALKMGMSGGASQVGGGILPSTNGPLNPLKPEVGREVRLRTPRGVDIFIGSEDGGGILIGASGVHVVGAQVSINGKLQIASSSRKGG
jgi:hypothetical protein